MKILNPSQNGFALVTGLILMLVVTVAVLSSTEMTVLNYRIATNTALKAESFHASESGREAAGEAVQQYLWERTWTGTTLPTGLTYAASFDVLEVDGPSESRLSTASLDIDMQYNVAASADGESINSDIYVLKGDVDTSNMSGLQQLSGYHGAGRGAATGGTFLWLELRSVGYSSASAETITSSDFRAIIR